MLTITITGDEQFNDETQEFCYQKQQTLQLEHSLLSLSKWEAKWNKPFYAKTEKTNEEVLDYVKCMTLTNNVDPDIYLYLSNENVSKIREYIDAPMTATTIRTTNKSSGSTEQVTSELIYYWMIAYNIPFECQKWHLNRLMTLIRVCEIKNQPPKKMSKREILNSNSKLNEARRKQLGTKG